MSNKAPPIPRGHHKSKSAPTHIAGGPTVDFQILGFLGKKEAKNDFLNFFSVVLKHVRDVFCAVLNVLSCGMRLISKFANKLDVGLFRIVLAGKFELFSFRVKVDFFMVFSGHSQTRP